MYIIYYFFYRYLETFDGQNEIRNLVQYRFQRGSLACHNNESELIFNSGGLGELHYILQFCPMGRVKAAIKTRPTLTYILTVGQLYHQHPWYHLAGSFQIILICNSLHQHSLFFYKNIPGQKRKYRRIGDRIKIWCKWFIWLAIKEN